MADAVTTNVVFTNTKSRRYVAHLTCISDGTGETDVVKVDKSALTNPNGIEPPILKIASIRWNVQGFAYVKLAWDHDTDDTAVVLTGSGYDNWEAMGFLRDPNSTGGTGDLLLTSNSPLAGAVYDITIELVV